MHVEFDANKDALNRLKHGVSLALARDLEWATALTWDDQRHDYGERRQCALVLQGSRLYFVAFVERVGVLRAISVRKANDREVRLYVENA